MRRFAYRVAITAATVLIAVVLAGLFAQIRRGGTSELPGFSLWSLPLALTIALVSGRVTRASWRPLTQGIVAALCGMAIGIGWTFVGWFLVGGWMLAWDFPVLYCWAIAGAAGLALGSALLRSSAARPALTGFTAALLPLGALWLQGTKPQPAVLIVYRDHPEYDAAQRVLDSVLTRPYPGGGRETKWPTRSYTRIETRAGESAALIRLDRKATGDSIRAALANERLVVRIVDTTLPR